MVRAVVLCEGRDDVEVLKTIARRFGLQDKLRDVAVTDSEGIYTLRGTVLPTILSLVVGRVVRAKPLALVVDADKFTAQERVKSIVNSLQSRRLKVLSYEELCDNVWLLDVATFAGERVPILVAVNGIFQHPFENLEVHELEDHIAYLKLLTGSLGEDEVKRAGRASQLVTSDDFSLIESVDERIVERAFRHMLCLLEKLYRHLQARLER